jgi:hypothetical protein
MKVLDWLESFYYKFYSESTLPKYLWVRYFTVGIMAVPFSIGMIGTVTGWMDLARLGTWVFIAMLTPFVIGGFIVHFYHNQKLKKLNNKWK